MEVHIVMKSYLPGRPVIGVVVGGTWERVQLKCSMSVKEVLAVCLREARGIHVGDRRTASFALFEELNVLML
jgi:hypothetical protein